MGLLQNGLASAIVTLCVFAICAVLWMVISPGWPIFVIGWVIGIGTVLFGQAFQRWWAGA